MSVQTFEAVIDGDGNVRFVDEVRLRPGMKVTVQLFEPQAPEESFDVELPKSGRVVRIGRPRLADPSQFHLFEMKVVEAGDDAGI